MWQCERMTGVGVQGLRNEKVRLELRPELGKDSGHRIACLMLGKELAKRR